MALTKDHLTSSIGNRLGISKFESSRILESVLETPPNGLSCVLPRPEHLLKVVVTQPVRRHTYSWFRCNPSVPGWGNLGFERLSIHLCPFRQRQDGPSSGFCSPDDYPRKSRKMRMH